MREFVTGTEIQHTHMAWQDIAFSDDGSLLAYSTSSGGSDWAQIQVSNWKCILQTERSGRVAVAQAGSHSLS
jgi:hypothetical protein